MKTLKHGLSSALSVMFLTRSLRSLSAGFVYALDSSHVAVIIDEGLPRGGECGGHLVGR